ncbi:hypothetical protein NESM_000034600 [Novymonas esmeraldas]|uniref:Uncharacterized protein n=1 Tax=Novymonas esmeraldas TaxID=1808958 RepID=A0AAW0F208_9TRYP
MSTTIYIGTSTARPSRDDGSPASAVSVPSLAEAHDLTLDELKGGLSDLGHNRYGELVYTRCDLAARHLRALPALHRYIHLQRLCVDDNGLTELDAVRHMPQLVHLHARRNRLTSDVFGSLAVAAAGCLERLYLDDNCITSLSGLERLPFLLDFTCCGNRIRQVPASCLGAAQRLMRFAIADNVVEEIEINAFAAARQLRVLELEGNLLSSTEFLQSLTPQAERVNIANNRARHLSTALTQLTCLTALDVGRNGLVGLTELRVLRSLKALRTVTFSGNAALEHLPLHATGRGGGGGSPLDGFLAPPQATAYHTEVVMSDEEEDAGRSAGSDTDGATTVTGGDATASGVTAVGGSPDDSGMLSRPSASAAAAAAGGVPGRDHAVSKGVVRRKSSVAVAAPPTTAAYACLAAPETHGFVRAVGSAGRDAELSVRVHHHREILALPESEQVYLWTLSVLPQLTEMNGRAIHPAEVAKAMFLFGDNNGK